MSMLARNRRVDDSIPTASLADIAFLLLVFFLTTTVFNEEKGLPLVLPDSEIVDVPAANILFLLVEADGTISVQRGASELRQAIGVGQVESIVREALRENARLVTAIKTDPAAEYQRMIDVLDAAKLAGATRISLQSLTTR